MRRLVVSVALLLAPQEPHDTLLARLDTDGDGAVSFAELQILPRSRFDALDRDANGSLSEAELEGLTEDTTPEDTKQAFDDLDTNGDERLQKDELPEHGETWFERLDHDRDGSLDIDEWQTAALDAKRMRSRPAGMMRRLLELDTDGDGRLARDELPETMEFLRASFAEFDLDGDGFIDGRELRVMTEGTSTRWPPKRPKAGLRGRPRQ